MRQVVHACVAVALLTLLTGGAAAQPPRVLAPGDAAPAFSLVGSDGRVHRLEDYRGRQAVVLAWFPAAFTGGCTAECKSLKEHSAAIRQFDVAYFTASVDTPDLNKEFAEYVGADYPILSDPEKQAATAYGVIAPGQQEASRWTFFIGVDGKILHIDKQVSVFSHGLDVASKLAELGVAKAKK